MLKTKIFTIFLAILVMICVFGMYVYIGTYIFPIAPYWITQLPPNPPKPNITYGEFNFVLDYSIHGVEEKISDTLMCKFEGFEVVIWGDSKTRVWSESLKNDNSYELFRFRENDGENTLKNYSAICIKNIGEYKIVLDMPPAEWFLSEPTYLGSPDMPNIQVYDSKSGYYLYPEQRDRFLVENDFQVVEWYCDERIQNTFA